MGQVKAKAKAKITKETLKGKTIEELWGLYKVATGDDTTDTNPVRLRRNILKSLGLYKAPEIKATFEPISEADEASRMVIIEGLVDEGVLPKGHSYTTMIHWIKTQPLDVLADLHAKITGRVTTSNNTSFILRRIDKVFTGVIKRKSGESRPATTVLLCIREEDLAGLDEMVNPLGFKTRMEMMRQFLATGVRTYSEDLEDGADREYAQKIANSLENFRQNS